MSVGPIPSEWLRGTLSVCVLGIIGERPSYGYALAERLEEAGLGTIKAGTLYPLLARLEAEDLIRPVWHDGAGGPSRKYLHITETGRAALVRSRTQWRHFSEIVDRLAHLPEAGD